MRKKVCSNPLTRLATDWLTVCPSYTNHLAKYLLAPGEGKARTVRERERCINWIVCLVSSSKGTHTHSKYLSYVHWRANNAIHHHHQPPAGLSLWNRCESLPPDQPNCGRFGIAIIIIEVSEQDRCVQSVCLSVHNQITHSDKTKQKAEEAIAICSVLISVQGARTTHAHKAHYSNMSSIC